ncbi:MAG: sugar transferase [Spirochaetes bacterium]|nr:sugar transferase [Spirochaetota bacterium]
MVFLSVLIDILLVNCAEFLAFLTRFGLPLPENEIAHYHSIWFLITLIRIWALYSNKAYENKIKSFLMLSSSIMKAALFSTVLIGAVTFFSRTLAYSRSVIFFSLFYTALLLLIKHYIFWKLFLIRNNIKNVVIMGATESAKRLIDDSEMFTNKYWKIVGFIDNKKSIGTRVFNKYKILGSLKNLKKIINQYNVNLAVIALPNEKTENKLRIMTELENSGLEYLIIPNFYEIVTGRSKIDEFENFPILEPVSQPISLLNRALKRCFDILFSLIFLIAVSPLFLIIGFLIKTGSPGQLIYKQLRAGRNGKPFFVHKFRTMIAKADKVGPKLTRKNDTRITKTGRFLRRWSLDELPQFYDILIGNMSVVGPRPEVVEVVKKYKTWQRKVLHIKPGLTGYAQIRGRQELDIDTKLKMDLYYINNYSLLLDSEIIFKTVVTVFKGEGAF